MDSDDVGDSDDSFEGIPLVPVEGALEALRRERGDRNEDEMVLPSCSRRSLDCEAQGRCRGSCCCFLPSRCAAAMGRLVWLARYDEFRLFEIWCV